jgi:hypothetical protein
MLNIEVGMLRFSMLGYQPDCTLKAKKQRMPLPYNRHELAELISDSKY